MAPADGHLVRRGGPSPGRTRPQRRRVVIFTAATLGLLLTSLSAERLAKRRPQRTLIVTRFLVTVVGATALVAAYTTAWS
ncbi:hypothetical protein [Streptomyces sp. B4I13]|uniref:hypothetical protein n=1 Tax=Streptomyces sp. B4I13 TaxID=3042271 RepID=UPI0027D851FB|nr:hypothetical protein [Streptomyces sp. B4I13]